MLEIRRSKSSWIHTFKKIGKNKSSPQITASLFEIIKENKIIKGTEKL